MSDPPLAPRAQRRHAEADIQGEADPRPGVWTGHVILYGADTDRSAAFYEVIGMRRVAVAPPFAIMEMRGGTHLVVRRAPEPDGGPAPFDLMVEDLVASRERWLEAGVPLTEVGRDHLDTHNVFTITDPDGNTIVVHDSHVVGIV